MNTKYIHPLYEDTEEDIKLATEYLVDGMIKDTNVAIFDASDSDGQPIINMDQQNNKALLKEMTKRLVQGLYGVNITTMANFHRVQDVFYSTYASFFIKYLDFCGIKSQIANFNPASISPYAIKKVVLDNNGTPLMYYNPNEKWDFKVSSDVRKNIMNPLNGMDIVVLTIYGIRDKLPELLKAMYGNYSEDDIQHDNIAIKILPAEDFDSIQELVKILSIIF